MKPIEILFDIFSNQITVKNIAKETKIYNNRKEAAEDALKFNYDVCLYKDNPEDDIFIYKKTDDSSVLLKEKYVISDNAPIIEIFELIIELGFVFVKTHKKIRYIITPADFDSIPVRILLFGLISLFEYELREVIRREKIDWEKLLSKERLEKCKELYEFKKSRNEEIDLLDCTQLIDLMTIIKKSKTSFIKYFLIDKLKVIEEIFKEINLLRDELAHAQRITLESKRINEIINFIKGFFENLYNIK